MFLNSYFSGKDIFELFVMKCEYHAQQNKNTKHEKLLYRWEIGKNGMHVFTNIAMI